MPWSKSSLTGEGRVRVRTRPGRIEYAVSMAAPDHERVWRGGHEARVQPSSSEDLDPESFMLSLMPSLMLKAIRYSMSWEVRLSADKVRDRASGRAPETPTFRQPGSPRVVLKRHHLMLTLYQLHESVG